MTLKVGDEVMVEVFRKSKLGVVAGYTVHGLVKIRFKDFPYCDGNQYHGHAYHQCRKLTALEKVLK